MHLLDEKVMPHLQFHIFFSTVEFLLDWKKNSLTLAENNKSLHHYG